MLTQWAVLACFFATFFHEGVGRVLLRDGAIRLSNSKSPIKKLLHSDFQSLFDRRLRDSTDSIPPQRFAVRHDDDYKKLRFMEIVSSIQQTAKDRHLKIKSVQLGRNIRKVFENEDIAKVMNQFVNDPSLPKKLAAEKKKKARLVRARRLLAQRQKALAVKRNRKLNQKMNFEMAGDMTQMPFPPMVMNGPHFHPPMNVTINQLPSMNPRAENDPLELQAAEYRTQVNGLKEIEGVLAKATGTASMFDSFKRTVDEALDKGFNAVKNNALA